MCRLLGFVSRQPRAVRDMFPSASFEEFTALSRLHGDGWGMAWHDPEGMRRAGAPAAAVTDPEFGRLTERVRSDMGMLHLRWATDGLAVQPTNTHPFVDDGLALAHNGSISPIGELEELLAPQARSLLRGTTDSERYFRLVLERVRSAGDTVTGVREAVQLLAERFPRASLNALVMDGRRLLAVHVSSAAALPLDDLREQYPDFAGAPADHATAYFRLRHRVLQDAVAIASTGVTGDEWLPVPPNSMLVVDRHDLTARHVELSVPAVASS